MKMIYIIILLLALPASAQDKRRPAPSIQSGKAVAQTVGFNDSQPPIVIVLKDEMTCAQTWAYLSKIQVGVDCSLRGPQSVEKRIAYRLHVGPRQSVAQIISQLKPLEKIRFAQIEKKHPFNRN